MEVSQFLATTKFLKSLLKFQELNIAVSKPLKTDLNVVIDKVRSNATLSLHSA